MVFFAWLFVVYISKNGALGCSLEVPNVPVVPFCENHQRVGRTIVTSASSSVPENQNVECVCDVEVFGTQKLIATYESPGYPNCAVELHIGNKLYSCSDSITYIDTDREFQMVYRKTTSRENPEMCIKLHSEVESSSITVLCKKTEKLPFTTRPTTQKHITTTSFLGQESSKITFSTNGQHISVSPAPSSVTNGTSLHSSLVSYSTRASSKATVLATLPSSASGFPNPPSTVPDTTDSSDLTDTTIDILSSTYIIQPTVLSTKSTSPTTKQSTTVLDKTTTEDQTMTENNNSISTIPQTSFRHLSMSTSSTEMMKNMSSARQTSPMSPTFTATKIINATFANVQTNEDGQWKTVVIICSVVGCVLLLIIAVSLSIIIYRHRTAKTKKTFNTPNREVYIDAFDPEDRAGKNDEVSLSTIISTDHVNEPSKRLYSILHLSENDIASTPTTNRWSYVARDVNAPPSRDIKIERQLSFTRESLKAKPTDTDIDYSKHSPYTLDRGSFEPWTYYDHVIDNSQDQTDIVNPDLSGWVGNDATAPLYSTVTTAQQLTQPNYNSLGKNLSSSTKVKSNTELPIYAIVRKPKDMYLQKKRTKLVSFKDYENEEEDGSNKPKGILKNYPHSLPQT